MAKADLDVLSPDTADQARFIIQAQALIDPESAGQLLVLSCTLATSVAMRSCSMLGAW